MLRGSGNRSTATTRLQRRAFRKRRASDPGDDAGTDGPASAVEPCRRRGGRDMIRRQRTSRAAARRSGRAWRFRPCGCSGTSRAARPEKPTRPFWSPTTTRQRETRATAALYNAAARLIATSLSTNSLSRSSRLWRSSARTSFPAIVLFLFFFRCNRQAKGPHQPHGDRCGPGEIEPADQRPAGNDRKVSPHSRAASARQCGRGR